MNRKEQEILERIRTKTDQIETPDSLRPEAVRQQLAERKIRKSGTWRKAVLPGGGLSGSGCGTGYLRKYTKIRR